MRSAGELLDARKRTSLAWFKPSAVLLSIWVLTRTGTPFALRGVAGHKETTRNYDLVVGIITRGRDEDHKNIAFAKRTWLQDTPFSRIVVLSHKLDPTINSTISSCSNTYSLGVCCKTAELFRHMYALAPSADWYLRATDDSLWHIQTLLSQLKSYSSSRMIYLGSTGIVRGKGNLRRGNGEPHAAGGSGYILSNALTKWFVVNDADFLTQCWHDDLSMGHYLRQVLGVTPTNLVGVLQEPQLKEPMPPFRDVPMCTCPLPPPLYYNTGVDERLPQGYAVLNPFVPYSWDDAVAWHAKPKFWPSLLDMSKQLQEHRQRVENAHDTLLVFMETDSVIDGSYETLPSFAQDPIKHPGKKKRELLPRRPSICLMKPFMRRLSYLNCNVTLISKSSYSDPRISEWIEASKNSFDYKRFISET